jgi:hypothetical protein
VWVTRFVNGRKRRTQLLNVIFYKNDEFWSIYLPQNLYKFAEQFDFPNFTASVSGICFLIIKAFVFLSENVLEYVF